MTNAEILSKEITTRGITEPVDTFPGWKRRGFKVKKGSKATFKTKIWKPSKKKIKDKETGEEKENNYFILVNAFYFTADQVEKIEGSTENEK